MKKSLNVTLKTLKYISFTLFCIFPFILTGMLGKVSELVDTDFLLIVCFIPLILIAESSILLITSEKYLTNTTFGYTLYDDMRKKKIKYKYFFIALLSFDIMMLIVSTIGAILTLEVSSYAALKVFLFVVPIYFLIRIYRCIRRLSITLNLIKSRQENDEKWKVICKELEDVLDTINAEDEFFDEDKISKRTLEEIDLELKKRFSTISYVCDLPKPLKEKVLYKIQAKAERYLKNFYNIDD